MRTYLLATILLFAAAMFMATGAEALDPTSCRDRCVSYCCTDSKCTKKKQSECYYDCLRSCDSPKPQTQPAQQVPPS